MSLFQTVALLKWLLFTLIFESKRQFEPNLACAGFLELSKSVVAGEGEAEPCKTRCMNCFSYCTMSVLLPFCSVKSVDMFMQSCKGILQPKCSELCSRWCASNKVAPGYSAPDALWESLKMLTCKCSSLMPSRGWCCTVGCKSGRCSTSHQLSATIP